MILVREMALIIISLIHIFQQYTEIQIYFDSFILLHRQLLGILLNFVRIKELFLWKLKMDNGNNCSKKKKKFCKIQSCEHFNGSQDVHFFR